MDTKTETSPVKKLLTVTILVGFFAGIGGMLLALLLHFLQHVGFGYAANIDFPEGIQSASPMRRFSVVFICGLIAGIGWYLLYRFGKPLVGIVKAVKSDNPRMPILSTWIHALLQVITVALGSPLGREVAPREVGASIAGWLSYKFNLTIKDSQIMVACGAGAGLAAVYNVPLAGALFVLEVLLCSFKWQHVLYALATSVIAAMVAWIGLGDIYQYPLPHYNITSSFFVWAVILGPVCGIGAYFFDKLMTSAREASPRNHLLPIYSIINFAILGVLACYFPALLGNGQIPLQLSFAGTLTIEIALCLLILKIGVIWGSLRSGAEGGLLTPGLACGALLAFAFGTLVQFISPDISIGAFALIGAAAFLASSMKMPLTAMVLVVEFTHMDYAIFVPMIIAITGSYAVFKGLKQLSVQSKT